MENTVGHVATWVIAGLRHRQFGTLAELRAAVYERMEAYNRLFAFEGVAVSVGG